MPKLKVSIRTLGSYVKELGKLAGKKLSYRASVKKT
jgi:hypothetical protein